MSTSSQSANRATSVAWKRALEAVALAAGLAFVPELVRVRTGAIFEPHPGWIAVLVLAARHGSRGLIIGLIASALAIGTGSVVAGRGFEGPWGDLDSGPNLITFGACLAVSWVASWQLRRQAELAERARSLVVRATRGDAIIKTLGGTVATLRSRVERTTSSLSFLRDVASRLEGKDPVAAADGAAELALARSGARAVEVRVGTGGFQRLLAVRDARGPKGLAPLALNEADRIVPIRNESEPVGLLALWGVPRIGLDEATERDLDVIASWCAPALAVARWRPEESAGLLRRAM